MENYSQNVKSSANWTGGTYNASLDKDNICTNNQEFALRANKTGTLASGELVNATGVTIATSGISPENGHNEGNNALWLKLADVFAQDTYSGTIMVAH
jgi:hypothetical protein